MNYETYNHLDDNKNHVHVEVPYDHLDGAFGHMTRIAEHGASKVIMDGGFYNHQHGRIDTVRFIYNWGSGPVVEMVDGMVTKDTR